MKREEALELAHFILGTRPTFKGFLKTKEETVYWVVNQLYVRGFEIRQLEATQAG